MASSSSAPPTPIFGAMNPVQSAEEMARRVSALQADLKDITPELIAMLTAAAHAALTSVNRDERERGAEQLLFLSSFDFWETTTKRLLPYCGDNALRFMVCKAMVFMVANELGPSERAEVKLYVLAYVRDRREAGEALPVYVAHELFLVYASALFNNWKIAIISDAGNAGNIIKKVKNPSPSGPESWPSAFELAAQMVGEVSAYLTAEEAMDCLGEVIAYFSRHVSKTAIPALRSALAHGVLPYFFETAAQALDRCPLKAAEVCCAVLECMSPLTNSGGLMNVKYTTEATIHILRWADGWDGALSIVMSYAGSYLCAYPAGPLARLMGRLVHLCSRIDSPHEDFMRSTGGGGRVAFAGKLIQVSTEQLAVCQRDSGCIPELLPLAAGMLVNTFERHDEPVVTHFIATFPRSIQTWADATQYVLSRFSEDEDDLRQVVMHLFFLFADRLLPRRRRTNNSGLRRFGVGGDSDEDPMSRGMYGAIEPYQPTTKVNGVEVVDSPLQQQQQQQPESEGPLGRENSQHLAQLVEAVFTAYLTAVVDKAHLREDSDELRFESGVSLHNERTLTPLAEMLYCDKMDFLPMMAGRLMRAIEDFQVCAGAREAAVRSGGRGAAMPDDTAQRLMLLYEECFASSGAAGSVGASMRGVDPGAVFTALHTQPLLLMLLSRVCLSRLSVLISIFAIAIQRNTHATSDEVLLTVGKFARGLLTDDDSLTNDLLQTLDLCDFSIDESDTASGDGGGGVASLVTSSLQGNARAPPPPPPTLHIGILRSLFFFCNCMYESNFARRPEFIAITLDLLRFVYLYHSDEAALMVDANVLFKRVITEGPATGLLLSSDKLTALVQAVRDDAVPALRLPQAPPSASSSSSSRRQNQQPLPPAARNGFYTAFTAFAETRFYAGYPVGDVVSVLFARALEPTRLANFTKPCLEELIAITAGIQQPDTLIIALAAAINNRDLLVLHVMPTDPEAAALVITWISALCVLATRLLEENSASTTQWELTSLAVNAMTQYFALVSSGGPGHINTDNNRNTAATSGAGYATTTTRFYEFGTDAVDATVVYSLADILQSLCTACWSNLGVAAYYERSAIERFFCGSLQLLTSISPPSLMSSERGKKAVFSALITALAAEGGVFDGLFLLLTRQGVWAMLLGHLTGCLRYNYLPEVVQAMLMTLRNDAGARQKVPEYNGISERIVAAAFYEVAVLMAVEPFLEIRQLTYVFGILHMCFASAAEACSDKMKVLLSFCSAYHRVRLRTIWQMLLNNEKDMLDRYVSVFGQSSKVATLTPW